MRADGGADGVELTLTNNFPSGGVILEFTKPVDCKLIGKNCSYVNDPRLTNFDGRQWLSDVCTFLSFLLCVVSAVFRDLQAAGVYPIDHGKSPSFLPPPTASHIYGYSPSVISTSSASGVMMPQTTRGVSPPTPGMGGMTPINIPDTSEGWWPYVVGSV